jgi:hypothetical protein
MQQPPSDEGGGSPQGETEGENDYPSVKNQRFLTAPLTRGAKNGAAAENIKFRRWKYGF